MIIKDSSNTVMTSDTYTYDDHNKLFKTTHPDGTYIQQNYDNLGNLTTKWDENGNLFSYAYDSLNRLTSITDPMAGITSYTYDRRNNLLSVTDANINATSYTYSNINRLSSTSSPDTGTTTYTYDPNGNLKIKTDAAGIIITYDYDALNRLTKIDFPTDAEIIYTYDNCPNGKGRLCKMQDASGTSSYEYSIKGQVAKETTVIDNVSYVTQYSYDLNGNLTSVTYPSSRAITYTYGNNKVMSILNNSSPIASNITYKPFGGMTSLTYGNNLQKTVGYDQRYRISSLTTGNIQNFSYTYNSNGNITGITNNLDPTKTKTYSYDPLSRLSQATGPWGTLQYSYDPVGNRTGETSNAGSTNYSHEANKLFSSTGVKPYAFGYDNNGNTVSENQRQYIYNQNQRLIKVTDTHTDTGPNTVLGEYLFNGNGQRVKKAVSGKTTYFVYDQYGNLIAEADEQGKVIADYIYLGSTPIARADMNRDILPPVTTTSVGSPFYQNGDILYISSITPITLSAEDEGNPPSGIDYTEYRIDNETSWTSYINPFNLNSYANGYHTIYYRSADKAGNIEDIKSSVVYLDTIAPTSTINIGLPQYQEGNSLYIGGGTPVTITATDNASGISKIEYSIDGDTYVPYAGAFTLASYTDGTHTIRYRSVDNVLNTEAEKTVTLTIDSTPPVTAITASDPLIEGLTNTVSSATRFSLYATDNLSGVKTILYRIDNGSWNTYYNGFTLSGAGTHTIAFKAIDNLGNEETEKTLTVKLIAVEVTKAITLEPVVLAGAWYLDKDDKDDDDGGDDIKDKEQALHNLANILSSSGIAYYIPQSNEDFKETLRSGRYNTYILVDFKNETIDHEIREAVHYGDGLIFIKTSPEEDPRLDDVFGVKYKGKSKIRGLTVQLKQSPISDAGTLRTAESKKVVKVEITSATAQSIGYVNDRKDTYPVIISNHYGRGRVILFSFDLLSSPEQDKARELLLNSINHVKPQEYHLRALESVPVRIRLNNSSEPVDLRITEAIPYGTTADTINPQATQTSSTIRWRLSLSGSQKKTLGYYLNLPDISGDYTTNTEVTYSNYGNYRLYGNYGLNLNVSLSSTDLLWSIINDLYNLIPRSRKDTEKIQEAIEELNKINQNAITRKEAKKNIKRILEAIEELSETSMDTSAIRLRLDELLKIWQKKWSILPPEKEDDKDDDKDKKHSFKLPYKIEKKPILIASTGSLSGLLNAPKTSEALYFYHTDHLGTPIMMTDEKGAIVWEGEFLPFGEAFSITGTVDNNLRFPGQYYDNETGTHYNYFRDYNPNTGRYLEKDPIGFAGGDINLYSYVGNNPVNFVDPMGLYMFPGGDLYGKCMENAPKDCKQKYDNCMKKCKTDPCSYDRSKDPFNRHCEMVCTDDYIGCIALRTAVSTYCRFRYFPNPSGPRPTK